MRIDVKLIDKREAIVEVQITQGDISSLAQKLAGLEADLTPPERALLLLLLDVAADSINRTKPGTKVGPLVSAAPGQTVPVVVSMPGSTPSIHDQFSSAFTPGARRVSPLTASVGPGKVD